MKLLVDDAGVRHISSDYYDDGLGRNDTSRWRFCEVRERERTMTSILYTGATAENEIDGDPTCMLCIVEFGTWSPFRKRR